MPCIFRRLRTSDTQQLTETEKCVVIAWTRRHNFLQEQAEYSQIMRLRRKKEQHTAEGSINRTNTYRYVFAGEDYATISVSILSSSSPVRLR